MRLPGLLRKADIWAKQYLVSLNIEEDPLDLILMSLRVSTPILISLFVAILLGAQTNKNSDRIHVVRLDTSTIDIFSGIYKSLGNSISSDDKSENYGEGLTTAQIIALTNYTSSLLANTPDYISSSLYSTCSHYTIHWRYRNHSDPDASQATTVSQFNQYGYDFETSKMTCYASKLFDYRALISANNLDILLTISEDEDDSSVLSDSHYQAYQERNTTRLGHIPKLLIFIAVLQLPIFILTIAFYHLRRYDEHFKSVKVIGHINAVATLIICLICGYAAASMTIIFQQVKSRIHSEFSAFNISLHFGTAWFALVFMIFAIIIFATASWVGPMWCSAPDPVSLDVEETDNGSLLSVRTPFTEEMSINIPSIANQIITDSRYPTDLDRKNPSRQYLIRSESLTENQL